MTSGRSHKKFLIDNILRPEFGNSVVTNSTNTNTTRKKIPDSEKILTNETLPSWIYCTRYSDRPSCSGRRGGSRRRKLGRKVKIKRPRTSFNRDQLATLEKEFADNPYLTEARRQNLAQSLDLQESQIKIWFQNKRAKRKKDHNKKNAATTMSTEEAVISSSEAAAGKTAAAAALLMTQK